MGEGNVGFLALKCKYTNCYTTIQRTDLWQSHKKIDAVVVHGHMRDELRNELRVEKVSVLPLIILYHNND